MQRLKEVHQPKRPSPAGKGTTTQGVYWDGRRKFHGDRHLLFELTRYEVRPDWGTPYPCNVKNLASYRRRPKKTRKKPLCNELATSKLVKFLNEPIVEGSKERAALYRLASGMQLQEWGPDLIIKAFDDIDLVFFRGVLATRTQISYWTEQQIRAEGELSPVLGFCNNLGYGRSHIVLNSSRIFLQCRDPFAQMWTTMLHEMVHAYFDTLCDDTFPSRTDAMMGTDWSEGGHGHCFRRVITAVDKRLYKYFHMYATSSWEPFNLDRCKARRRRR